MMFEQGLGMANRPGAQISDLAQSVPVARLAISIGVRIPSHCPEGSVVEYRRGRHLAAEKRLGLVREPVAFGGFVQEGMEDEVGAGLLDHRDELFHPIGRMLV